MINAQMSFRFDCLQTGGVQRFKCSPLFFILINKVTVSVAIKSFQSGDSRRPHSGLFTAHPKIKLFLESNLGDDNDNHYYVLHDDVDGNVCDDVEDADDWDEQGIMIVVVCAEQPVLKHPPLNLTILFKVLLRCSKVATGSLGSMWHCGFRLICFEIRGGNGPNPLLQNATVQSPIFRETSSFRYFLYSSINTAVLEI